MRLVHSLAAAALLSLSCAAHASGAAESPEHDKPGFVTFVEDGRLWIFRAGSKELEDFRAHGEPMIMSTRIGVGPAGMTVRSVDAETLEAYLAQN